jgi:DNA repair protein RadA/Sms
LRISEPAADLAVAAALISALTGTPVPADTVVFCEIGLSGEIRSVSQADSRLKEASKLGFERALAPARRGRTTQAPAGIKVNEVGHLQELVDIFERNARRPTARQGAAIG